MRKTIMMGAMAATLSLLLAVPTVAAAHESSDALPPGTYTLTLPGGGTFGFDVSADGSVAITVLPDGLSLTDGPMIQDDGFMVTLTDGVVSSVLEVEVESEDGAIEIQVEIDEDDADEVDEVDEADDADDDADEADEADDADDDADEADEADDADDDADEADDDNSDEDDDGSDS